MAPSFANRSNVAVDVEAIWHHLGATDLGTEFGVVNVAADLKKKINLLIHIIKNAPQNVHDLP